MEKDKKYKIIIEGDQRTLTFTGKIIDVDENFVTFIDMRGETLSYNLKRIIYFKEVVDE